MDLINGPIQPSVAYGSGSQLFGGVLSCSQGDMKEKKMLLFKDAQQGSQLDKLLQRREYFTEYWETDLLQRLESNFKHLGKHIFCQIHFAPLGIRKNKGTPAVFLEKDQSGSFPNLAFTEAKHKFPAGADQPWEKH